MPIQKKEQSLIIKDFSARKLINERARLIEEEALNKAFKKTGYILGEKINGKVSVNPLLFARGFAKVLANKSVCIYEHSELTELSKNSAVINEAVVIKFKNVITARGVQEKSPLLERFLTTICLTQKLTKRELSQIGFLETEMFSDDEGHSFFYGKITKDRRLLVGYGDLKRSGHIKPDYTHLPHVRAVQRFLKKTFPLVQLLVEHAWSAEYAISKRDVPVIQTKDSHANINGGGTQVASMVAAEFVVNRLLKKKHPLLKLFQPK